MIKEVLKRFLYAFFPLRCDLCGEVIALDECRCGKCLSCDRIVGDVCSFCGHAVNDCSCRKKKNEYKSIVAPYYFKDNLVVAIHRIKFRGYSELAYGMGCEIADCVKERYSDVEFDCITYVPLSKKRQRKRGYNQSERIAYVVAKHLNLPVDNLLIKVFNNKVQRSLSAKQRQLNVYGAYDLIENKNVKGKTILLIDDVKTTGSTLNECAKMLKGYGAKDVYAATLAITKKGNKK